MREVSLNRFDGGADIFKCYTYKEFDWLNMPENKLKVYRKKHPNYYFKMFATFDIETTTIIPDDPDECPWGFMYHWQMDIGGVIVYGRTWEEWIHLLERIVDWLEVDYDNRFIIYVHNLSYEFQFIRDILNKYFGGFEVFASQERKPIYVTCNNGIEFRCSYKLSNMSLAKACENELGVIHPKAAGDLDYKIKRTAVTELNNIEFGYCIADVVCLYEYIQCKLKNEKDTLVTIPMTSTGYVRRDCRNATRKESRYREKLLKTRIDEPVYLLLKEAGRGGNTHANRYMSGRIWHDVDSFDVVSSYPAQMMLREYPVASFCYYGIIESMEELNELVDTRPCLFRIVFCNIQVRTTTCMPYIPISKAIGKGKNIRYDNGRVLSADTLAMTITDLDYKIIRDEYIWDSIAIADFHISKYGPLPESLKGQVMSYYKDKCELKDKIKKTTDKEELANLKYLYAKSKNRLNGIFGMCYTDPVHSIISIDDDGNWVEAIPKIDEALDKYYNSRNNFLSYAWGCWITCWARIHLEDLINATGQEIIYCDTDSSKCICHDHSKVDALNKKIMKMADDKKAYYDINGTRYYLGIYELETKKPYKEFITLGAKKYVYTEQGSEDPHVTISGVNKKLGSKELKTINNFKPGFIFKDAGGSTLYYNDVNKLYHIEVDGCRMLTGSNIGMIDSTYEIGLTGEYAELIGYNLFKDF